MPSAFDRLKARMEKLVFAGLKPDAPAGPKKSKLDSFVQSAEELAARGLKPDEKPLPGPVSWRKKVAIGLGVLAIGGGLYALAMILQKPAEQAEKETAVAPPVPIVPEGFKVDKNKDLEVVEMDFDKTKEPKEITGTLRNLTDRQFAKCEVSFDVTTRQGAQLGGAGTTVSDVPPHGSVKFRIPVTYPNAGFVMVRELRPD